jgi:hypothetical protein
MAGGSRRCRGPPTSSSGRSRRLDTRRSDCMTSGIRTWRFSPALAFRPRSFKSGWATTRPGSHSTTTGGRSHRSTGTRWSASRPSSALLRPLPNRASSRAASRGSCRPGGQEEDGACGPGGGTSAWFGWLIFGVEWSRFGSSSRRSVSRGSSRVGFADSAHSCASPSAPDSSSEGVLKGE